MTKNPFEGVLSLIADNWGFLLFTSRPTLDCVDGLTCFVRIKLHYVATHNQAGHLIILLHLLVYLFLRLSEHFADTHGQSSFSL